MPRIVRSSFSRNRIRRRTEWTAITAATGFTTLGQASVQLVASLTGAQVDAFGPFTIVRTIGYLSVVSDQGAAAEAPMVSFGAAVVSEQARVAGVASLPTPGEENESDLWFAYENVPYALEFSDATGIRSPANAIKYFDQRAKRRVSSGEAVVFVIENKASAAGSGVALDVRMLLMLH